MSDKVITIAIFTQNVHALYAKNSLEEADIKVFLSGENTVTDNALRASAIGNIRVQILETDLEKAAPIIEKVRQELEETQENPVELEDETWQREKEEPENVVPISSKDSFARRNLALFAALAVLILWAVWFFKYSGKFNQLSGGIDATFTLELPPNADATCDVNVLVITLEKRLLLYGLARSNMVFKPARQQIEVELKGIDDIERVSNLLTVQGKLEFWETYENREIYGYLVQSNEMLASILEPHAEPVKAVVKGTKEAADTGTGLTLLDKIKEIDGGAYTVSVTDPNGGKSPLFSILQPAIFQDEATGKYFPGEGPVIGYVAVKDTAELNRYLNMEQIKEIFPGSFRWKWEAKPYDEENKFLRLLAIKVSDREGRAPLEGNAIVDAYQDFGQFSNQPEIYMSMNAEGTEIWKQLTAANIGKALAIVIDDKVYSFPTVNTEIPNGRSNISGAFTINEAKDFATLLNVSPLPCRLKVVDEAVIH